MKTFIKLILTVLLTISQLPNLGKALETEQDLSTVFTFANNFNNGIRKANIESKPVMLVVHSSRCRACIDLRPRLIASIDVRNLSRDFVMVNVLDGSEQLSAEYGPSYVPRILFIGNDRKVLTEVTNLKEPMYGYYYEFPEDLVDAMRRAKQVYKAKFTTFN